MGSISTSIRFSNTDSGLNHDAVLEQLTSATRLANSGINIKGYDDEGDIIKGSNDDFVLLSEMDELSKNTNEAANECYERYEELVNESKISLPRALSQKTIRIISNIYQRFS
ncbi:hypothetical protein [Cronobacter sakazakii]|nr:hypothetical protein [Cronobacter sakazakii]